MVKLDFKGNVNFISMCNESARMMWPEMCLRWKFGCKFITQEDAVSFLSQSKRRIILCYICLTKLNVKWRIWITEHQYKSSLHSAIEAPKAAPFIWLVTLSIKLTLLKFIWWPHKENSQTLYQMPDVSVKTWHMKCLTLY